MTTITPLSGPLWLPHLIRSIESASTAIWAHFFSAHLLCPPFDTAGRRLHDVLSAAVLRHVDVRISTHIPIAYPDPDRPRYPIRRFTGIGTAHAKVVVIDHRVAYLGSHNLTGRAHWANHELSLAIECSDTVPVLSQYIRALWERSDVY